MPEPESALLLSLRPRFADLILSGEKDIELRRTRPTRAHPGTTVLLYAASPQKLAVGTAKLVSIHDGTPSSIWKRFGRRAVISKREFDAYYQGATHAIAIEVADVRHLDEPVPLALLRSRWKGFRPPQSFRYIRPALMQTLV